MIPKNIRNAASLLFMISAIAGFPACQGGGGGKTIVKVGNTQITEGDLETLVRVNPRLKPRLASPTGKDKVIENYVEQEILYQESIHRGLNRSRDVKDKIALYEKILVAQALLDGELEKKVKEYYDNHKDEFERVKVLHILIKVAADERPAQQPKDNKKKPVTPRTSKRSEAEALKLAESVLTRLNKGEDFSKVAKEVSEDERTKPTGGDLGYITLKDKRLERWEWLSLAEKAFAMKVGEVSEPIKSKAGYHLIKVSEEKALQPYEEAEAGIKFRLQADIRTQILDDLKQKYKVVYAEKSETATPPAPEAPAVPTADSPPAAPATN